MVQTGHRISLWELSTSFSRDIGFRGCVSRDAVASHAASRNRTQSSSQVTNSRRLRENIEEMPSESNLSAVLREVDNLVLVRCDFSHFLLFI